MNSEVKEALQRLAEYQIQLSSRMDQLVGLVKVQYDRFSDLAHQTGNLQAQHYRLEKRYIELMEDKHQNDLRFNILLEEIRDIRKQQAG